MLGGGAVVAGGVVSLTAGHLVHNHRRAVLDDRPRQIALAWPNPELDPVLTAALQKDIFAAHNLDVSLIDSVGSGRQAIDALRDGRAVVAAAPVLTWLQTFAGGVQDARLFCGARPCTFRLLVRKAAGIPRVDQMKGHSIAILRENSADRLFFSIMLKRKGVDPAAQITWRPMGLDDVGAALQDGSIDAVAGHDPIIWEVLQRYRPLVNGLFNSVDGNYGQRTNMALAMSAQSFAEDPVLASVLAASFHEAGKWVVRNPQEAVTLLADHTQTLGAATLREMLLHEPAPTIALGHALRVQVEQYIDELKLLDMFPTLENATSYAHRICVDLPTE
ncbi:hypothetical protein AA103196_1034 [Ameyamaea chiangmaiensis NBRC 103196]|nr:hypothetical protein AA103196_1034 [Ameyamaea chiangmaiensis NBRC 103196]